MHNLVFVNPVCMRNERCPPHMNEYGQRSDIKDRRLEKPIGKHFNSIGHSLDDLSIFVVEKVHREDSSFHKAKES